MELNVLCTGAGSILGRSMVACLKKLEYVKIVIGVDANPNHLMLSGAARNYHIHETRHQDYRKEIEKIVRKENINFIMPMSDADILALKKIESLSDKLWLPRLEDIELCQDKYSLYTRLEARGIPVPKTILLQTEEDMKKVHFAPIWARANRGAGGKGARLCEDYNELLAWITLNKGLGSFQACEYLPGRTFGFDSLWKDGKLVISSLKEKVNMDRKRGDTTIARTLTDARIEGIMMEAVKAVNPLPDGLYAVDSREDKDGKVKVTEINCGRFMTTSTMLYSHSVNYVDYIFNPGKPAKRLPDNLFIICDTGRPPLFMTKEQMQGYRKSIML